MRSKTDDYKKSFQSYYDKHHREKNPLWHKASISKSRAIIGRLGVDKGRLLDVGCGTGELLKVSNVPSFGIDISIEGLITAKNKFDIGSVAVADQEFLPFKDNSFDYVTMIGSLVYCLDEKEVKKVLKEIRRVTAKDAKVYIKVRNGDFLLFRLLRFLVPKEPHFKHGKDTIKATRYKDLTHSQWTRLFEESGFNIEKAWKDAALFFARGFVFAVKSMITAFVNVVAPINSCYGICYVCKKKEDIKP